MKVRLALKAAGCALVLLLAAGLAAPYFTADQYRPAPASLHATRPGTPRGAAGPRPLQPL